MTSNTVIVGSGISGLLCALLLCHRGEGSNIIVVEKNDELGGLLGRFHYGEWGDFDYGPHNLLETGIGELDKLLFNLLPETEWQLLEGSKRDLAGVYFNGILQKHTPYIDLRNLSQDDYRACLVDFLEHLDQPTINETNATQLTASDYAVRRFGELSSKKTTIPAIEKIYQKSATELDFMATILAPMTRLAFCSETLVRELTQSPRLRDYVAWDDQRTLPLSRSSGRKAIYPKRYGMHRIIDAIIQQLIHAGVKILTKSEVIALNQENGLVKDVVINCNGHTQTVEDIKHLIWTASIPLLGRCLGMDLKGVQNDKPLKTVIVNMVVDQPPAAMDDLYYFYCYDHPFHTFRLTNFINYCPSAGRNGGYPISMELLMDEKTLEKSNPVQIAAQEYDLFGLASNSKILFSKAECINSGFPMLTVNNVNNIRLIRDFICDLSLSNVQLFGILAKDNLFFQTDILTDIYQNLT
jgi:protoporphyrinogen oxidase